MLVLNLPSILNRGNNNFISKIFRFLFIFIMLRIIFRAFWSRDYRLSFFAADLLIETWRWCPLYMKIVVNLEAVWLSLLMARGLVSSQRSAGACCVRKGEYYSKQPETTVGITCWFPHSTARDYFTKGLLLPSFIFSLFVVVTLPSFPSLTLQCRLWFWWGPSMCGTFGAVADEEVRTRHQDRNGEPTARYWRRQQHYFIFLYFFKPFLLYFPWYA